MSADGLLASIAQESSLRLWLPCAGGIPVSCDLSAASKTVGRTELCPIGMAALAFTQADTIDLFVGLCDSGPQTCAASLRYWRILANYAMSLLLRRQFVPDIQELDATRFTGRWRVFVDDRRELRWLERLVSAMPNVCRAVVSDDAAARPPAEIVDSFIAQTTEAVIYRSLSNDPFFQQIHDRAEREEHWELRWLSGLLHRDRIVQWSAEDGVAVAGRIRSWIGQLEGESREKNARLCFTLLEPQDADNTGEHGRQGTWRLRFDLRAAESGELLDIAQVWRDAADAPSVLGRHLVNRRSHLLNELARASAVFTDINKALATPTPTGIDLDTDQAHAFIHQWGPLLRVEGFTVDLPPWATTPDHRLGLELYVRPIDPKDHDPDFSLGSAGLSSMLDFDWRVAVGDDHLSLEEFENLSDEAAPLIKVRGQWVDLDRDAVGKALDFVRRRPHGQLTLAEAIRLAAGAEDMDAGLPIVGLDGVSWVGQLLADASESRLQTIDQPAGFNGTMRGYQLRGLAWLAFLDRLGIGACLADDMGLGKTIEFIALLLTNAVIDAEPTGPAPPCCSCRCRWSATGDANWNAFRETCAFSFITVWTGRPAGRSSRRPAAATSLSPPMAWPNATSRPSIGFAGTASPWTRPKK